MYSKLNTPPGCLQGFRTKQRTRGKHPQNHTYGHSKKAADKAGIGTTSPIGVFQHSPKPKPFEHQAAERSCLCESASELRAAGTNDTWDNKSLSKPRLQLQFPQQNPVFSLHKSPPKARGCFHIICTPEIATQGVIRNCSQGHPKLCDLGQALLWLCSVRVEGTAVPGLQFWEGGAGGAAKRLDGLMVWLRIYWQGRISIEPGDAATMGIKNKNLLQTPPENIFICLSLIQVSWSSHTQSTSLKNF